MSIEPQPPETPTPSFQQPRSNTAIARKAMVARQAAIGRQALFLLVVFVAGLGGGYFVGRQSMQPDPLIAGLHDKDKSMAQMDDVNLPDGYEIPAVFGDAGPQLLAAGTIDLSRFTEVYGQAGKPLTDEQLSILTKGSSSSIVIDKTNAYFLLNFFWALGLTNQNPALTEGEMRARGKEQVGKFASTGGWTLGTKPAMELYASTVIIALTDEQQARLMKVASAVYRPCCNNPTHLPDCNHGMAMLGLLELMASQNADEDEMFNAAKYVNAFWFPEQTLEIATLFKTEQNVSFAQADARKMVSQQYSSSSGFQGVHRWLVSNGFLKQAPGGGVNCGV